MTAAVAAVFLMTLALAAIGYPLLRRSQKPGGSRAVSGASPVQELLDRREALLVSMKDLEADRGLGNVDEAEYQALRAEYEEQAVAVLKALDARAVGLDAEIERMVTAARSGSPKVMGLALALAALALWASPAAAQQPAAIEGTVVNGTTGAVVPVAPVVLVALRGGVQVARREAVADGQGRFRFEGLEVSAGLRYIVGTRYLGVEYTADAGELSAPEGPLRLSVFETTGSDEGLSILRASIAVPRVDQETGLIQALEVVTFANRGDRTYVGDLFSDPQRGGVLRVLLPPDALDLTQGDGFGPDPVPTQEGVLTRAPVPPGQFVLIYAYKLPFTDRVRTVERSFAYPVERAAFLIAATGPRPSSDRLTGVETVDINGVRNFSLSGQEIQRGERIAVTLTGLPPLAAPASRGGGVALDTALRGAGIALLAALAAGLALYTVFVRRSPGPAVPASEGQGLAAEQRALVASLAELDELFEAGRIPEDEYRAARSRRKQRLVDVMMLAREQGEGQPT